MKELTETPLLPPGFKIPTTRYIQPSVRMRQLLETEPYLFGPGVYDPFGAQLAMYYGLKAVYFSGYSFAIGHLGTTDMDGGYGNIFNVQRTTELYVNAGVAAAHIEDQVLPKRCGNIGGKALIPVKEMVGKLGMARNVADDWGNPDFVVIARTDGLSACEAPESLRHMDLAVEPGLRYLDTGIPDLLWCEFPTSDRGPLETFTTEIKKRFPKARFAFNWSSSFKWYNDPNPLRFSELAQMDVKFIFITLGGQHATGFGLSNLLQAMAEKQEQGYIALQRQEWSAVMDYPTKSHHFFSGVPYHHLVGKMYDASRLGQEFVEDLPTEKVV